MRCPKCGGRRLVRCERNKAGFTWYKCLDCLAKFPTHRGKVVIKGR